jgi:hypothetical protein
MADRVQPHISYRKIVRCQSERSVRPQSIVVHATQSGELAGVKDLAGVGTWFDRKPRPGDSGSSAHVCVDGEGHSARFVADSRKAWHVYLYNSLTLGVEQIGFTDKTEWTDAQLKEVARWIARWSVIWGIPIQKGRARTDRPEILRAGVFRHSELGAAGGSHFDPGVSSYPLHDVLDMARGYRKRIKR